MKTGTDLRHIKRIKRFKRLFTLSFNGQFKDKEIDNIIVKNAPEWPIEKLNKVDLAILRLALNELYHHPEAPPKVVIDEAIEIGKTFGTIKTPKFINGVLGSIIKNDPRFK